MVGPCAGGSPEPLLNGRTMRGRLLSGTGAAPPSRASRADPFTPFSNSFQALRLVVPGVALTSRAMAAHGDRGPGVPRLPAPLGTAEAVLDPAPLFVPPKRAPFEPGKARYTS